MPREPIAAILFATCIVVTGADVSALDLSAITVQLGAPVATSDSGWSGGTLSGSVALDLHGSSAAAPVVLVGTSRGLRGGDQYQDDELSCAYVAMGARFVSKPLGAARGYLLVGGGIMRAENRAAYYNPYGGARTVGESTSTGAMALLAIGAIVALPGTRVAIVAEVSDLIGFTGLPGAVYGDVPRQILVSAGVRVPLRR